MIHLLCAAALSCATVLSVPPGEMGYDLKDWQPRARFKLGWEIYMNACYRVFLLQQVSHFSESVLNRDLNLAVESSVLLEVSFTQ